MFVSTCHRPSDQVFGCSLEMLCERERSTVPRFVRLCTEAVERRGTVAANTPPANLIPNSKWTHEKSPSALFWAQLWAHGPHSSLAELTKHKVTDCPTESRHEMFRFAEEILTAWQPEKGLNERKLSCLEAVKKQCSDKYLRHGRKCVCFRALKTSLWWINKDLLGAILSDQDF